MTLFEKAAREEKTMNSAERLNWIAKVLVFKILRTLMGRKGLNEVWDKIDQDTQGEIVATLEKMVADELKLWDPSIQQQILSG